MCFKSDKIIPKSYNENEELNLRNNYMKKCWCKPRLKISKLTVKQ